MCVKNARMACDPQNQCFSLIFDVGCLAGRVPRKQKESEIQSQHPDQKTFKIVGNQCPWEYVLHTSADTGALSLITRREGVPVHTDLFVPDVTSVINEIRNSVLNFSLKVQAK